MADDELARIAADQHRKRMGVRDVLAAEGRPDLVADLDRKMWEIETGVYGARSTWAALSSWHSCGRSMNPCTADSMADTTWATAGCPTIARAPAT